MLIEPESARDFPEIHDLVKIGFQTAQVSNGREQDFVDELRAGPGYIPELARVARLDGRLVGHIMLTRTVIRGPEQSVPTLLLGPITVVLAYRGQGIGSRLVTDSLALAAKLGHRSVVLVGHPSFYHRFGFVPSVRFGIRHRQEIPDPYVMACELVPGALADAGGVFDT